MFPVDAKMLLIDDSGFARTMLKSVLKELSYIRVIEAKDAVTAQKMLGEEEHMKDPVHLIFCDQHMPEMNGIDFIKWLRTQERYKCVPIIMLSTSQEKAVIVEAGKFGVSNYMIKPFDNVTLKGRLAAVWEKHGQKYYETYKPAKAV